MDFFFFGTLRERSILETVIGGEGSHLGFLDGHLPDHNARVVQDEDYPVLVPAAGELLPGVVVRGLSGADMARIRFFEDSYYEPLEVCVSTSEGQISCHVFASPEGSEELGEIWDFETWPVEDREVFRLVAEQFMSRFGHATFEEVDADWEIFVERARAFVRAEKRIAGKR